MTETNTIKNLKLTSNMVIVIEKLLTLVGCYKPHGKSCQGIIHDRIVRNVDSK